MSKLPPRKTIVGQRESLQGTSRLSSTMKAPRATPLLRSARRPPLSAAKTNQRESYIGTVNHHIMKETRPLSDKSYIRKSVLEIIQLLAHLNYPNTVHAKTFNPPTNKEYQRVFEFMAAEILGTFRILCKPDEEMLKVLKDLAYPFNLSKSMLNNVGTMSSWPNALGALTWLAELVKYSCGLDEIIEDSSLLSSKKKLKQDYLYNTYNEFMNGKDGPYDEHTNKAKQSLAELDAEALKTYEEQKAANVRLTEKCERKLKEKEACSNLGEEIASKKNNIEKMRQYLTQCDDYINVIKSKTKEVQQSIQKKDEEIESTNENLTKLKMAISQQELSPSEAEKLTLEKRQLEDSIKAATDRAEQVRSQNWETEILTGKLNSQMDVQANKCNDAFKKLHDTLPSIENSLSGTLKCPEREEYSLILGYMGIDPNQNKLSKLQPFLTKLNSQLLEVLGATETKHYNMTKRAAQYKEMLTDLETKHQQMKQQYDKLLKENELQEEEYKRLQESFQNDMRNAENAHEQLRSEGSSDSNDLNEKLSEMEAKIKAARTQAEAAETAYKNFLVKLAKKVREMQAHHSRLLNNTLMDEADKVLKAKLKDIKERSAKINCEIEKQLANWVKTEDQDHSSTSEPSKMDSE